jgi:tripartite-type tricarboxylate transporter receptor subunit TctC
MRTASLLLAAFLTSIPTLARGAETYPERPVRILTGQTGGGSDIVARLLAPALTERLGQQVVVDNRAGGVIVCEIASRATPDGHTLLVYPNGLWLLPYMRDQTPYKVSDFAPVSLVAAAPLLLVVHPSVPAQSAQDLIALARAKPGSLNYASGPLGAAPHLAGELFKAMAAVDIVHVPFKGIGLALNDVVAGRVQIMFPATGSAVGHLKAGRLRALAVTSAQPSPLAPGVPTLASSGVPGYELVTRFGAFVPAKTPAAVKARLHKDIAAAMQSEEVRNRFLAINMESLSSTPEALAAAMRMEQKQLGKVIRERGIRAQ